MWSLPLPWDSHGEAVSEWEKCQSTSTKDSKVRGCLSWKDVGYNRTDQAYMLIPVLGFQLVTENRWRPFGIVQPMVDQAVRCQRCSCGPPSPWHFCPGSSVPSSCKFISWGISALCAGSQGSKKTKAETKSGIQTLPEEGNSPLVVQTKIREWLERRTYLS